MWSGRFLLAIPVFNEERYVAGVLRCAHRYIDDILIVDDGSIDGTAAVLAGMTGIDVIHHPENRGYGQSLRDAFEFAVHHDYDWLISMDCDEQHEPSFIPHFIAAAADDDADLISGSRYLGSLAGNGRPPADRRRINRRITRILNAVLGLGITDAFCGFKAYRVEALRGLDITVPGYAMPLQFWVQAWRADWRIRELPVRLIYNDPSRHFGGLLDDPHSRYEHYLEVLRAELASCCRADREGRRPVCSPCSIPND